MVGATGAEAQGWRGMMTAVRGVHSCSLIPRRTARRLEVAIVYIIHLTLIASLTLLLSIAPSWAQPVCAAPGCNPTVGDGSANTAGGSHALENLVIGPSGAFANTAFGDHALFKNSIGSDNTAVGSSALFNNTTGIHNTAVGWAALESNN